MTQNSQILQKRFQKNIYTFKTDILKLSNQKNIKGQEIIHLSGDYFQALEDLIIAKQSHIINENTYNSNISLLDKLLTKTAQYIHI